ncbi:MAG: hypothetical protein ACLSX5_05480 [Lachnospiraceae bacterium]
MSTSKNWGGCLRTTIVVMLGLAFLFGLMGAIDGGVRSAFFGILGGLSIGAILGVFYAVILLLFAKTDK